MTKLNTTRAITAWREKYPNERLSLTRTDLSYANLTRADLTDTDLSYANLFYADLTGAILTGTNLTGAYLANTNFGANHVWQFGPAGSRKSPLTIMHGPELDDVRTGCFHGTLAKFETAVAKTHGDNQFGQEYRIIINCIRALIGLNATPQLAHHRP